jgi:hypothetical protein
MTQTKKDLLLKDLCARLPYGVKITVNDRVETLEGISVLDTTVEYDSFLSSDIEEVKPYLFPMSSMTEEQKEEWKSLLIREAFGTSDNVFTPQDFYNKNHIDYRGLIPMGLAEDATGKNVY